MAKSNNTIDYRIKLAIESKEYYQALRKANQEAKEFKKQQRDSFKTAGKDAGDAFSTIVAMAKKAAPAIGGTTAAYKIINTAIKENQTLTDEWARITESATASYESFVDTLVNADFSGFFSNLDDVVAAARDAADAIDNLDTTSIFASKGMADIQLAASKYRYVLRSKTSSEEEKAAARAGLQATREQQLAVAQDLRDANLEAFAAKLADYVSRKGFKASASDFLTYDENGRASVRKGSLLDKYYGDLATYREMDALYKREQAARGVVGGEYINGAFIKKYGTGNMSNQAFEELRAFMELADDSLKETFGYYQAGISEIAKVYDAMASDSRYLGGVAIGAGGTGGGATPSPAGSIAYLREQIAEYQELYEDAITDSARNAAKAQIEELENQLDTMINGAPQKFGAVLGNLGNVSPFPMGVTVDPSKLKPFGDTQELADSAKNTTKYVEVLSQSIQSLGLISMNSNSEFAKVMTVVQTFLSLLDTLEVGKSGGGKWYDVLFKGIGSIFGFAGGGIVGGTSYRGDRLPAMVNSGEMFLNGFQQKQLFDIINKGGSSEGGGSAVVTGENIYIALRNYGRRAGKKIIIE